MDTDITKSNNQPFPSDSDPSPAPETNPEMSSSSTETPTENQTDFSSNSVNFNTTPSSDTQEPITTEPSTSFSPTPEKPKQKTKMSNVLMLIMVFITLCGVGFGVYGFFFKEPKTITKTVTVEAEKSEEVAQSSPDYIYIGEWGIKIKKPADLKNISYSFNNGILYLTGIKSTQEVATVPEFAQIEKMSLGALSRIAINEQTEEADPCTSAYQDENYKYCYSHNQDVYSTDETNKNLEVESANLIQTMLTTKENYSKF